MTGYQFQIFSVRTGGGITWRLLAGNNREAGRGAQTWATESGCRRGVDTIRTDVARGSSRIHRVGVNRWAWELRVDTELIAVSGPSYDRMIRCEQALALFVEHAPAAVIGRAVIDSAARRGTGPVGAEGPRNREIAYSVAVHPMPADGTVETGPRLPSSRPDPQPRIVRCETEHRECV